MGYIKLKNTPSVLFWSDSNKWSLRHVWADKKFLVRQVGRWTRGQWGRWVVSSARWPPNHLQDSCLSNHHPGTNSYSASAPVRSTSTLKVRATLTLTLHYIRFYFMSNASLSFIIPHKQCALNTYSPGRLNEKYIGFDQLGMAGISTRVS